MRKMGITFLVFLLAGTPTLAETEEYVVGQKNKSFVYNSKPVDHLKVEKGDTIHFKNMDPFFHNVFSLSDVVIFDLGSYPKGESRAVTFNTAGKIDVECAIHPQMHMVVEVVE